MEKIVPSTVRRRSSSLGHRLRSSQSTYPAGDDKPPARVVLTADVPLFDPYIVTLFRNEGFQVSYLRFKGNKKEYDSKLQQLADDLESDEKYAIVGMCHIIGYLSLPFPHVLFVFFNSLCFPDGPKKREISDIA
jgi:hypothetical protein